MWHDIRDENGADTCPDILDTQRRREGGRIGHRSDLGAEGPMEGIQISEPLFFVVVETGGGGRPCSVFGFYLMFCMTCRGFFLSFLVILSSLCINRSSMAAEWVRRKAPLPPQKTGRRSLGFCFVFHRYNAYRTEGDEKAGVRGHGMRG